MNAPGVKPNLTQRKKAQAMRRAQEQAIDLFEKRGFASVSMIEVAEESDVSVASLFRYFGTKEQVVLWDEHDDRIINAVAAKLETGLAPLAAVAAGVAAALDGAFGPEALLERRKMALIFKEPALLAAFRANTRVWAEAFAPMFARTEGSASKLSYRAAAAAASVLVEVCLEEWFGRGGRADLSALLSEAFSQVGVEISGPSALPSRGVKK
jgi:AcrR family transcriptional regulator